MVKILDWKAQRSGAFITIIGKDEKGGHLKVAAVKEIIGGAEADPSTGLRKPAVAVTESGLEYELA